MFDEVVCGDCGESLLLDECDVGVECPACGAEQERLFRVDDTNGASGGG